MVREKNHDYAHLMFAQCVAGDPANLTYAEAMLRNLRAKFPKPPRQRIFQGGGGRLLKQAASTKDRAKAFQLGIELLKSDPWDVASLRMLAQVCAQCNYNEVELVYLKQAIDANPKDIETNRHCAISLARMGQFDQAIACWHRIETIRPGNTEVPQMIAKLSEEKLKYPGGRPPVRVDRTSARQHPQAIEQQSAAPVEQAMNSRQKLERAIKEDPHNCSSYLELAELLVEANQLQPAELVLIQGMSSCGNAPVLKDRLDQIRRTRSEQEFTIAQARRSAELKRNKEPFHLPWLETILVLAAAAFVLQIVPSLASAISKSMEFNHWSRSTWLLVNGVALLILFWLRLRSHFQQSARVRMKAGPGSLE